MQDSTAEMTEVGPVPPTSATCDARIFEFPRRRAKVSARRHSSENFTVLNGDNPRDPSQMGRGSASDPLNPPRNHKAGLVGPAFFSWIRLGQSFFDQPTQNVKILQLLPKFSLSLIPTLRRGVTSPHRSPPPRKAKGGNSYITNARFSSSYCRTGRAHPAISTRPAASRAALGETP
jgi:hypothetical protein